VQFDLDLILDDPDGGEHTETVTVTLCGSREDWHFEATDEQGNELKLTEHQQELAFIEAKGLD
jgi:hypothetical protein